MPERIAFDFNADWGGSMRKLEDIICYASWGNAILNPLDSRVIFLTQLLHTGAIAVYEERRPDAEDLSPELMRRADDYGSMMRKRKTSYALRNMAAAFPYQSYDPKLTLNAAPFFSELKAYIRCDGLEPESILEFFERDYCERVIVFPNFGHPDGGFAYYTFECAAPRDALMAALARFRKRQLEAMYEAIRTADEKRGSIIPSVPDTSE